MRRIAAALAFVLALMGAAPPSHATDSSFAFMVELTLTLKAAEKLQALKEKIVVAAYYYGYPSPNAPRKEIKEGISLGAEHHTVDNSTRLVTVTGRGISLKHLDWVQDRKVRVLTNVYSARRGDPFNLIDCGIFDDEVAVAAQSPVKIACKLIGE
jgi:hypothetical protein